MMEEQSQGTPVNQGLVLIMNSERGAVVHDEGVVIGHPCDDNISDHYNHDSGNNEKEVSENSG